MDIYKQICAKLVYIWDDNSQDRDFGFVVENAIKEARAALAEPEPASLEQGVQQMHPFVVRHYTEDERPTIKGNGFDGLEIGEDREEAEAFVAWINEKLARWGNYPGSPDSSMPQPVPVTERLPEPEDCTANPRDGQGQWCWGWCVDDSALPFSGRWRIMRRQWLADEAVAWLPAHALPVPS